MSFTSELFIVFLILVFICYYTICRKWQWQLLLFANYVFYAFSGWGNLIYISVTICATYFASRQMARLSAGLETFLSENPELPREDAKARRAAVKARRRAWMVACVVLNLGILAVVKYTGFVVGSVSGAVTAFGGKPLAPVDFLLPLGISFYTFQSVGYIIDIYRGKATREVSFWRLAAFVSFFPQLLQGPISRFGDLSKTLFEKHEFSTAGMSDGLFRVLCGFFKKLIVADRLLPAVVALTGGKDYGGVYALSAIFIYAVALYADFTGGIDVAIGVARCLGITLAENFDRPFYSVSITDYWRRWHITMGTWFRDYLFYPISVSRPTQNLMRSCKKAFGAKLGARVPVYISTLFVWFATGLWHGASWNFIVWGLANGFVIVLSQEFSPLFKLFHKSFAVGDKMLWKAWQVFRTFCLMSFIRAFDIFPSVPATFAAYKSVFAGFGASIAKLAAEGMPDLGVTAADFGVAAVAVILMVIGGALMHGRKWRFSAQPAPARYALFIAAAMAIIIFGVYGFGYDATQFIYTKF